MKNKMSKKTFIKRKAIKKRKGIKKRKTVKNYRKYKKGGAMSSTQPNGATSNVMPTNVASNLNNLESVKSISLDNITTHDLRSLQNVLNDHASKGLLDGSNLIVMEKLRNTYNAYNGNSQSFFRSMINKILP